MSIRPEDWPRLKELFGAARDLGLDARAAFIATACGDDDTLREEVETLLASHDRAQTFLETPAALPVFEPRGGNQPEPQPARIGHYAIREKLGEGGMGVVYGALDERLNRIIALKVIRLEAAAEPLVRERFWCEARLAASVNHPHICQLYEIGESEGRLFIAMERLAGESLTARLLGGAIPLVEAIEIGLQVLAALDALHRRGITHRDLKPSNIFLTPHGAKVLDFGVALIAPGYGSDTQLPLTGPGTIVGTPKYMAPEQLLGVEVNASADLFTTGAILYEMLAGNAAFEADTLAAVMNNVLHSEVAVLGGSPGVAAADRVIHRALAKLPAQRYATAAAMADDLRTVLAGHAGADTRRARVVTRLMVLPFRLLRADAEIDFLAFSLADAVTHSLASLESVVVRSTIAATQFATAALDLETVARVANVNVILSGTLLRAGDALRVSAQLIEVPAGTVIWSHTSQASLENVFQLQDDLARHIVESLALPLSGREHRPLDHDVPSSAKAYEFYLRANPLSHDSGSWEVARDLYLQCLQADPRYAPAWARLGRVYHVLGKYRGRRDENLGLSESALNRALELNPLLSIAHHFYAQLEIGDLCRPKEAMVRLVRSATERSSHPELFSALVSACRYCGLLQASLAAYERARRLDPDVRTSVQHTFFMMGDYERAAAESERHWAPGSIGALALLCAGHPDAERLAQADATRYANTAFGNSVLIMPNPDRAQLRAAVDDLLASGFRDPEGLFYQVLKLAHAGEAERAVEILGAAVDRGFFPYETLARHAWLDSLRDRPDFTAILEQAERLHDEARMAFVSAGGATLLGN